jgi:hypothetical protein
VKLSLTIKSIDTSKVLTGFFDAAFILKVESPNFDELENFRLNLLKHLRDLKFKHIKILTDDISKDIANKLYPEINNIENLLRRYLTKFFTQRIGLTWWDGTAPDAMKEKVEKRKKDRKEKSKDGDTFSELANVEDVALVDFDDLGELIYKQSSGFNTPESVVKKIVATNTIEELEHLKSGLQGNYTKYFKEAFRDRDFEKQWRELFGIRNKVAHNGLFSKKELEVGLEHAKSLTKIIREAEDKIEEFSISIEEQEAIRQATIETIETKERLEKMTFGDIGKKEHFDSNEDDEDEDAPLFNSITQEQLLSELEYAERTLQKNHKTYVGLKAFVTRILGKKGYSYESTSSLINILREKGLVEVYEVQDEKNVFAVKGIRIKKQNLN